MLGVILSITTPPKEHALIPFSPTIMTQKLVYQTHFLVLGELDLILHKKSLMKYKSEVDQVKLMWEIEILIIF